MVFSGSRPEKSPPLRWLLPVKAKLTGVNCQNKFHPRSKRARTPISSSRVCRLQQILIAHISSTHQNTTFSAGSAKSAPSHFPFSRSNTFSAVCTSAGRVVEGRTACKPGGRQRRARRIKEQTSSAKLLTGRGMNTT